MNNLDKVIETLKDQINYGPSESAMGRMLLMLEAHKYELENKPKSEMQRFTPGTAQFNAYVWNKANCNKDLENIASRYGITKDEVIDAYYAGAEEPFGMVE